MMEDIAMQLLEILMNSIHAKATSISISIVDSKIRNIIQFVIGDDGCGMSKAMVDTVTNPFTTSRTTRKIGLGVSFLKGLTEQCNGTFSICSEMDKGTTVSASVEKNNIDTPPLGDIGEMMMLCIQNDEDIRYRLQYKTDRNIFKFDSYDIKKELEGISLQSPEILLWIKDYINQGIKNIQEEEN